MFHYLAPYVETATPTGIEFVWPDGAVGAFDLRPPVQQVQNGFAYFASTIPIPGGALIGTGALPDVVLDRHARRRWTGIIGHSLRDKLIDCLWAACHEESDPLGERGLLPLRPTISGTELWIGGTLIRRRSNLRIWQPECKAALELSRRVYARTRQRAMDGILRDKHGRVDYEHHRRVLDHMGETYGVAEPGKLFAPRIRENTLQHATLLTDDFNRADDDSLGASWTEFATGAADVAGVRINSNACNFARTTSVSTVADYARYESDLSTDDHESRGGVSAFTRVNGTPNLGVCSRYDSTATNRDFIIARIAHLNIVQLFKFVADAATQIGSNAAISYASLPRTVVAKSTAADAHSAFWAGTEEVGPSTDAVHVGELRGGVFGYRANTGNTLDIDGWQAEDSGAAAGPFQPFYSRKTHTPIIQM